MPPTLDQKAEIAWKSQVFVKLFGRFKNARMDGVLFHMAWWAGLMSMNKRFDSGAMREVHE